MALWCTSSKQKKKYQQNLKLIRPVLSHFCLSFIQSSLYFLKFSFESFASIHAWICHVHILSCGFSSRMSAPVHLNVRSFTPTSSWISYLSTSSFVALCMFINALFSLLLPSPYFPVFSFTCSAFQTRRPVVSPKGPQRKGQRILKQHFFFSCIHKYLCYEQYSTL